jgi:hypothetical protein
MPGRLLNVSAFIAFAVLLGLAGSEGARGRLVALSICIALLLNERSRMWEWVDAHMRAGGPRLNLLLVFWIGSTALIGAAGLSSAWMRRSTTGAASVALRIADGTLRLALIGTFLIGSVPIWRVARVRSDVFRDRTNDALFRTAALSPGLLLTGANLHLVQLRTRHPVLLDGGGLDGLPYALESGPAMQQILLDVYGLDLFDPPAEARRTGQIPPRANRAVWEQYSLEKWQQIGRTYNVSDVLVDAHWSLALPVVARNNDFTLYRIADAWTR